MKGSPQTAKWTEATSAKSKERGGVEEELTVRHIILSQPITSPSPFIVDHILIRILEIFLFVLFKRSSTDQDLVDCDLLGQLDPIIRLEWEGKKMGIERDWREGLLLGTRRPKLFRRVAYPSPSAGRDTIQVSPRSLVSREVDRFERELRFTITLHSRI